jgi:hypothetical protein
LDPHRVIKEVMVEAEGDIKEEAEEEEVTKT